MNEDEVWAAIDTQGSAPWTCSRACRRRSGHTFTLRRLDGPRRRRSLDLAADKSGRRAPDGPRHGSINHINRENARMRAGLPTERLIADIRGMVGSRRHNFGLTHLETLIDIVVHGQDIAIRCRANSRSTRRRVQPQPRVWSDHLTRRGRWKMRSFAACPTSATGSPPPTPNGLSVRVPRFAGRSSPILMVLTGRLVCMPQLSGEGAMALREQLNQPGSATVRAAE